MPRSIEAAVRELCLAFPGAEEVRSHGSLGYRVRSKFFAYYTVNHHGDGRVALLVNAPAGMQAAHVKAEPGHYFVPPYVGPRGWLGIDLNHGIAWKRVASHAWHAYEKVAPARLAAQLAGPPPVKAPTSKLRPEQIDPFRSARGQRLLETLRRACEGLPGVSESTQFGHPVWRVGQKVFARAWYHDGAFRALFRVGGAAQALLTSDSRYTIPPYFGPAGWIALEASRRLNVKELRSLTLESYRHYAPRRLLAQLDP